jgi:hypothetical protein
MNKRYEPQDVERPALKNCVYSGYPPGTFLPALTEFMIRFNAGGGWRRVYISLGFDGSAPSGKTGSYYYVKICGGSRVEIEFPDGFYELIESQRAIMKQYE